jgi:universal stress protein F
MHKTILIPIDIAHIEKAQSMIDFARTQSIADGQIILLNVVEEVPNWVTSTMPANILGEIEHSARGHLTNIAKIAELDVTIEVRSGHPYQTILQVAGEFNADLIIVASHKPGMQDYFLGSTAAKVVRHAKCSVLVER